MKSQLSALCLALCAFGSAQAENTTTFEAIKIEAGKALFDAECHRCHAPESSDISYGPSLDGILGRSAGSVEGFEYSEALEESGIVWTASALRAWMEDNDGFMPGTRMRHVGIQDRTAQDLILTYLVSLSAEGGN